MSEATKAAGRSGPGFRGVLAWIAILALLGLVAWLAAERNARSWHLVPDEGRLVVMRGMMLPFGRQAFKTSDPALAQAYAPVVAPPGKPLPPEKTFEERALLDQALYDLLAGWARDEISGGGDAARLERGLGYLARAERLPGLSPAQRDDLAALRADSGYYEAVRLLARAADVLRDAAEKLRRAAQSRSAHATDAGVLLRQVEPALEATLGAARAPTTSPPAAPRGAKAEATGSDPEARPPEPQPDSDR
jgi:hypothetical protein